MKDHPAIWAIIPARGGSKGIPRKNVTVLGGKPLLAHSIGHAQAAEGVTRVLVSTDDAEIADVARTYGAEVVWRPDELSGDTAASEAALLYTLDFVSSKERHEPDYVVFLQPTSPLRASNDVQNAIDLAYREGADSLFSGCTVEGFTWRRGAGLLEPVNYDPEHRPRRQDLQEQVWEENGSIYLFKPWVLRQKNSRLGGKIVMYSMAREYSFQLDVAEDIPLLASLFEMGAQREEREVEAGDCALPVASRPTGLSVQQIVKHAEIAHELAEIRLLVLDFDGVMTDNRVLVDQDGREAAWCHRGDGWGIARLRETGMDMMVLSTEIVPIVEQRCRKLRIPCIHACDDKITALKDVVREKGLQLSQVAYVGNDTNDAGCLEQVGCPIVVADAEPEVMPLARYVTTRQGGAGAVREIANWFIAARGGK